MIRLKPNWAEDVIRIVTDCEEVQKAPGSEYSKEQEKILAYNEIRNLIIEDKEDSEDE